MLYDTYNHIKYYRILYNTVHYTFSKPVKGTRPRVNPNIDSGVWCVSVESLVITNVPL